MMQKTPVRSFLPSLRFPAPVREIFSRLGYSRYRTKLENAEKQALLGRISRLFALCRPAGCWAVLPAESVREDGILLGNGYFLPSAQVAARYPDAQYLWLGAVTIGPDLPAWSREAMNSGHAADALIADAVGGEAADAAMDFLQKQAAAELLHRGMALAQLRFSPGYGDWSLEGQTLFFSILEMDKLGVSLTPKRMMLPEKSVTAIAGVTLCG